MEIKKWTAMLLCIILCAGSIPIPCNAAAKKTSGTDGNGNTWVYDVKTKTLTFSGNKGIEDFMMDGHSPEPDWYVWNTKAEHIIINDGITQIGIGAFDSFVNLKTVSMADSVTCIKDGSFIFCMNLTSIKLSANIKSIQGEAFYGCNKLEYLPLIEIQSKEVKSIAKGSFSGLSSKVVIKVPKSRKKKYTRMLRKSGLEKKVKIKTL